MSRLLLDIGNSHIKAAMDADGGLEVRVGDSDADTVAAWLSQQAFAGVESVWASSVAGPTLEAAVRAWAKDAGIAQVEFLQSQHQQCGVRCAYTDPSRLGVDRWMVVLAAAKSWRNSLIVDAGTACTIDAVSAEGEHLGGLILPGVRLARQALNQRTHFSADDVPTNPLPTLGDDTNPAVTLGAVHALLGAIARVQTDLNWGSDCDLLMTGGEANVLLPHLSGEWSARPHLVLEGVQRVAQENTRQIR